MTIFIRWIILTVLAISIIIVAAIGIPRYLLEDSTLVLQAVDSRGSYHYMYDTRTQLLYLNETWQPSSRQIAPNGEYAVDLNGRGIRTVFIDLIMADGETVPFGEIAVDLITTTGKWSPDSKTIYMAGRSENGVTVYSFDIVSEKLTPIVEFEELQSQTLGLEYDPENDLIALASSNLSDYSVFHIYNLETGEQWTVEGRSIILLDGWKEYLRLVSHDKSNSQSEELVLVSLLDDTTQSLPLPTDGRIVSIKALKDKKHIFVTSLDPDKNYILDLQTQSYSPIDSDIPMISFVSESDKYAFTVDYFAYKYNRLQAWYKLDMETYELSQLLEPNPFPFSIRRLPETFTVSPDHHKLAMVVLRYGQYEVEIDSMETGELLHRFRIPENRLISNQLASGSILGWYKGD